jgi:hypothetical protein
LKDIFTGTLSLIEFILICGKTFFIVDNVESFDKQDETTIS